MNFPGEIGGFGVAVIFIMIMLILCLFLVGNEIDEQEWIGKRVGIRLVFLVSLDIIVI